MCNLIRLRLISASGLREATATLPRVRTALPEVSNLTVRVGMTVTTVRVVLQPLHKSKMVQSLIRAKHGE